jgi:hypothetical protein
MTAIDRLTAAQSLVAGLLQDSIDCPEPDCGDHDLPIAKAIPFTADLAAVLAVVEAAREVCESAPPSPAHLSRLRRHPRRHRREQGMNLLRAYARWALRRPCYCCGGSERRGRHQQGDGTWPTCSRCGGSGKWPRPR